MATFKFEANDGKSFYFQARDIFHAIQVLRSNRGYRAEEGMITQYHKCKFKITGKSRSGKVVFFDCVDPECDRRMNARIHSLRAWTTQNPIHPGRRRKLTKKMFTRSKKPQHV